MDKTPSLTRALVGLTLFIAVIAGGYLALKWGSDNENENAPAQAADEIRFERSGGFTGESIVMNVKEGGRVRSFEAPKPGQETGKATIASRNVDRIFAAIQESGWPDEDGILSSGGCSDCYEYDITYRGTRVSLFDPVPRRYAELIRLLNRLANGL